MPMLAFNRRCRRALVLVALSWLAGLAQAQVPQRLSEADARHLLARTGFAPSPAEAQPWVGLGAREAVERLIDEASRAQALHEPPAFTAEPIATPLRRSCWTSAASRWARLPSS